MKWREALYAEIGVTEVAGDGSNPRILEYAQSVGYKPTRGDADPWCGIGLGWAVKQAGLEPPDEPWRAISWDGWGTPTKPRKGAIARLSRGANPRQGHVGIIERVEGGRLWVLGANQNDSVSIAAFPASSLKACRWPPQVAAPLPPTVATFRASRTVTGVLLAAVGTIASAVSSSLDALMAAAAQVAEWAPAASLVADLGVNTRHVSVILTGAGLLLALYARFDAAAKGKEG